MCAARMQDTSGQDGATLEREYPRGSALQKVDQYVKCVNRAGLAILRYGGAPGEDRD